SERRQSECPGARAEARTRAGDWHGGERGQQLHAGQAGGEQVDRLSGPVAGGGGQAVQDFHVAAAGFREHEQQARRTPGPCSRS
ncbi:MAG: hypothetical protein ACK48Y_02465, partial [Planctomyces sp.]